MYVYVCQSVVKHTCIGVCVCVRVPKNIPVKIKAKASLLTSSFLAAATNEKCCRHNLQHFLLFMFSSCPRARRAAESGQDRHIWHWHTSAEEKRRGDRHVHCTLPCSCPCPCPCSDPHKLRARARREYMEYIAQILRIRMRVYIYDACAFL